MIETASPTEWLWTGVAAAGLALNLWALRDARGDLDALAADAARRGQTPREYRARYIVAIGNIRRESLRVFKVSIFVAIGLVAMATPPANPAHPVTAAGVAVAAGLIAATMSMVWGSWLDRRERVRLIAELDAALPRGGIPVEGE